MKDHWTQSMVTNVKIKFVILSELPKMWHRFIKWGNAIGKMVSIPCRAAKDLHFAKNKKQKKPHYIYKAQ